MSKRVMIWGAPSECDKLSPFEKSLEESGKNYGNILIGESVRGYLSCNDIISRNAVTSPAEANEKCDQVVIPAANFLWKNFDFGYMADFLEKTKLPVTMIGVGAQTNDRSITSQIHPNTLRLMRLVSERSNSIGVRGFYTAEVLAAHGIHNIAVIGCPSIYLGGLPRVSVDTTKLERFEKISVNFSRRVYKHSFLPETMRSIEKLVLEIFIDRDTTFVAQDEVEELGMSSGNSLNYGYVTSYFDNISSEKCVSFFEKRTRFFCNVPDWAEYMKIQDVSIGSRFHGNLIALVNGTPAVLVVHDSRTQEMAALLGIPHIHVSEYKDVEFGKDDILQKIMDSNFNKFEQSYRELYARFVKFLCLNGLDNNLINSNFKYL
ncbi:MAG: polysaccharide pyruvyl transferase family protein [Azonexus sp.]